MLHLVDKTDSSACTHQNISLRTEDHEHGRTTGWWECVNCKLQFQPSGNAVISTLAMSKAYTLKAMKRYLEEALRHHVGNEYEASKWGYTDAAEHHKHMRVFCKKLLDTVAHDSPDASAVAGPDCADRLMERFKNIQNLPDPDEEQGPRIG